MKIDFKDEMRNAALGVETNEQGDAWIGITHPIHGSLWVTMTKQQFEEWKRVLNQCNNS